MIVAEKMKNTVNQKLGKAVFKAGSPLFGLPLGGLKRDDHIPQKLRVYLTEFPFLHGKGDDISGAVAL